MGGPDSFGAVASRYEALLLLGGNVGDMKSTFSVVESMITHPEGPIGAAMTARSRDHWTEPWGFSDERLFLNRALLVSTTLEPLDLLGELLTIEQALGRNRSNERRYASRTIDIDILLIGDQVIDTPALHLPHPRLHERAFALAPAADVAPLWVHPKLDRTVIELLNDLRRPA
jgi:2-amino-4-hydroxy-6-hydroxymethyldihydropteridine diphosphokinase